MWPPDFTSALREDAMHYFIYFTMLGALRSRESSSSQLHAIRRLVGLPPATRRGASADPGVACRRSHRERLARTEYLIKTYAGAAPSPRHQAAASVGIRHQAIALAFLGLGIIAIFAAWVGFVACLARPDRDMKGDVT